MSEYFLGLIIFAFSGSVLLSLAPQGISKKYLRLLCGLCSVGCIVFPLFNFFGSGGIDAEELVAVFDVQDDVSENNVEIYNNSLNDASLKNAEETLKSSIIKELSVKYEDFDLEIVVNKSSEDFYIEKIRVLIYPSGYSVDPKKIGGICKRALDAPCEFIYR